MPRYISKTLSILLLFLVFLSCGCSFTRTNVNELLRSPLLEGDYSEIQKAISEQLTKNAHLVYPTKGDLLSPFLFGDWDGDGTEDAAVLFSVPNLPKVQIAILKKDELGAWVVFGIDEGLTDSVGELMKTSIQGNDKNQILVTFTSQNEQYLTVYALQENGFENVLEQRCSQFLLEDFTSDGSEDLVVVVENTHGVTGAPSPTATPISANSSTQTSGNSSQNSNGLPTEPTSVQILLLTYTDEQFVQTQVSGLDPALFAGYAKVSVGRNAYGNINLIIDGWMSNANDHLASQILTYNNATGQFRNAVLSGTKDLYASSQRFIRTLYSQDIDGDGAIEIPTQVGFDDTELLNYTQNKQISFVRWMDFTKPYSQKSFGLYDEEYGFYLELPWEFYGNLLLVDGKNDGMVEFRSLDGETHFATLFVGSSTTTLTWQRIGTVSSTPIYLKLHLSEHDNPDYSFLTKDRFKNAIYFLED